MQTETTPCLAFVLTLKDYQQGLWPAILELSLSLQFFFMTKQNLGFLDSK